MLLGPTPRPHHTQAGTMSERSRAAFQFIPTGSRCWNEVPRGGRGREGHPVERQVGGGDVGGPNTWTTADCSVTSTWLSITVRTSLPTAEHVSLRPEQRHWQHRVYIFRRESARGTANGRGA